MDATLSTLAVTGGFADPVLGSQAAFRRIMDGFARPGTIADLAGFVEAPGTLPPAAAGLLATLADGDAAVFLERGDARAEAWLAFQTGAAVVTDPAGAVFALLSEGSDPGGWNRFPIGTDRYPDRSATLILPVESLHGGPTLRLTGPGIATSATVAPCGLPAGFLAAREANRALFPQGHDLVLVCGPHLLALPRTTRIEER